MSAISNLRRAISKLGLRGTILLLAEKSAKKRRMERLLNSPSKLALLKSSSRPHIEISEKERSTILARAEEMLRDENYFFTFIHHINGIHDPWNFDPIENKYWPKRRYEETQVHSGDTPKDVKIVWEINRFKYLPLLAQAAFISGDRKFADEVESRIISWIDDNPFASTVNWSSPLELAIRAISWTVSLQILRLAGFEIAHNEKICRCLWQHAAYLNAELSTDKVVRSNHLIGETAGLFVLASFFEFPEAVFFKLRAKTILTDSVLAQTYSDGASRESSGWYHTFVTDFADMALRTAASHDDQFSAEFIERFERMTVYRNSVILTDGEVGKFGDCDFGKAVNLAKHWKAICFGPQDHDPKNTECYFKQAQHLALRIGMNTAFIRAGEFGWGGDGFSSHAHDDFLSPILSLENVPLIVDPGTFVYNGNPVERDAYRGAQFHNGLIVGAGTGAVMKPSFGWIRTRPAALVDSFDSNAEAIRASTSYGEWRGQHMRHFTLTASSFTLEDALDFTTEQALEWNLHFHSRWRLERVGESTYLIRDFRNNQFRLELSGIAGELELLQYEFAPSYMAKAAAWKIRMRAKFAPQKNRHQYLKIEITRAS